LGDPLFRANWVRAACGIEYVARVMYMRVVEPVRVWWVRAAGPCGTWRPSSAVFSIRCTGNASSAVFLAIEEQQTLQVKHKGDCIHAMAINDSIAVHTYL
jgi:hypothetical protein